MLIQLLLFSPYSGLINVLGNTPDWQLLRHPYPVFIGRYNYDTWDLGCSLWLWYHDLFVSCCIICTSTLFFVISTFHVILSLLLLALAHVLLDWLFCIVYSSAATVSCSACARTCHVVCQCIKKLRCKTEEHVWHFPTDSCLFLTKKAKRGFFNCISLLWQRKFLL